MRPPRRLILASSSPRRRDILRLHGIPFEVRPPLTDESLPGSGDPVVLAAALAREKARDVVLRLRPDADTVVLGADTLVVHGGRILGKPRGPGGAERMLRRLSGSTHGVVTALCLLRDGREAAGHEETRVRMRSLSPGEIRAYVRTGEPLDKAGAYAIQGAGRALVEGFEGDYLNVVGLPVGLLRRLLAELGGLP